MINVGINGFGRIGKCVFLQLLENTNVTVKAINIPDFDISLFEHYLKIDSNHFYKKDFNLVLNDKDLKTIKKDTFRNIIRKAAVNATLSYLNKLNVKGKTQ